MGIESLGHHSPGFIIKERGDDEQQAQNSRESSSSPFVPTHPLLSSAPDAAPHSSDDIAGFGSPHQDASDELDAAHSRSTDTDRSPLATAESGSGAEPASRGIKRTSSEESYAGRSAHPTTTAEAEGPLGSLREVVNAGESYHTCRDGKKLRILGKHY